ncbi:hypothetical protein A3E49_02970 [Candidatus Saccharibacteria bacterium RIFCSPHIGHO2_12_FULL_49_19]|nr:MAG: hypothetical protein A3E49_02970 [Candidatus Saccharibacteria bacterium RIFCSPHIGHO2_12_FULL_49_19]
MWVGSTWTQPAIPRSHCSDDQRSDDCPEGEDAVPLSLVPRKEAREEPSDHQADGAGGDRRVVIPGDHRDHDASNDQAAGDPREPVVGLRAQVDVEVAEGGALDFGEVVRQKRSLHERADSQHDDGEHLEAHSILLVR